MKPFHGALDRSTKRLRAVLPLAVILCLGLLTAVTAYVINEQARHAASKQHGALSARVRTQLVDTVASTVSRVQDIAAAVAQHWPNGEAEFQALAKGLLDDPTISRVGLIQRVRVPQRSSFEARHGKIRTLEPQTPGSATIPSPEGYFVVRAGVQHSGEPSTLGDDLGSDRTRLTSIIAAARSERPQATPPVQRIGAKSFTTALYVPVYQAHMPLATADQRLAALRGFVATGYRYNLLGRALIGSLPAGTSFRLADRHSTLLAIGTVHDPRVSKITVAGRTWTLAVGKPAADLSLLYTTLLVGLIVTVLGGALAVQLGRREKYALELVGRRISEREVAEHGRARAEERFRTAFAEAPIGMALTGLDGKFLQVNRALGHLTGHSQEELLAMEFMELTHPEDRAADARGIEAMRSGRLRVYNADKRYLHAAGHQIWVAVHCTLIHDESGEPTHFLAQIEDVTSRRDYESQLQHMADHDPVTGLLNRRAFERVLRDHMLRGERYGHSGAVLVLDLDHFKQINDTLGHSAGDDLLMRMGKALTTTLRESDAIARLGGDEFAVLLPAGGVRDAELVAVKVLAAIRGEHINRDSGDPRQVTASIGIANLVGSEGLTPEEALINADLAMYDAKEAGRNRCEIYAGSTKGQARIEARLEWVERIRSAIDNGGLTLHVQPVVDVTSGRTAQQELLVRMVDAHGDLILPESFLPIAERFGSIREIDRWVIKNTIKALGTLREAGRRPVVEINLSGPSLGDWELTELIERELRAHGVQPGQLIFEITETSAVSNIAHAKRFAEQLKELGCRFALDDFGTGFGSFHYLKHLPFDFIKINGEFVRNCSTDATDRLFIRAIVELAKGMGKRTIAELVGDRQTLETLRGLGVDYAQGFYLGRPAPLDRWLPSPSLHKSP